MEVLTKEQLSAYSLYMRTLGNRPDLFGKAQYPNASTIKQPTYYDIPPEALKDDRFAAMMEEAKVHRLPVCVGRQFAQHQL